MNDVTFGIDGAFGLFDDTIAASYDKDRNLAILRQLFERLSERGMFLNLKKCVFFKSELDFLGYKVSECGIEPTTDQVQALADFPLPKDVKTLQAISWYGCF